MPSGPLVGAVPGLGRGDHRNASRARGHAGGGPPAAGEAPRSPRSSRCAGEHRSSGVEVFGRELKEGAPQRWNIRMEHDVSDSQPCSGFHSRSGFHLWTLGNACVHRMVFGVAQWPVLQIRCSRALGGAKPGGFDLQRGLRLAPAAPADPRRDERRRDENVFSGGSWVQALGPLGLLSEETPWG